MRKPQRKFTREFKVEAVKLVQSHQKPLAQIARDAQARSAIFEYLECFYNPIRLHSTLQYVSPLAFEQAHQSKRS